VNNQTDWALQVAYEGSGFQGFQALPQARTVQGVLEKTLGQILKQTCPVVGAGRTDAGVHAYGQVVGFQAPLPFAPERLLSLLQRRLPADLTAKALWPVPAHFHARFSARARHYRYLLRLNCPPSPFEARTTWTYPYPIEPEKLAQAWAQCQGQFDFKPLARAQAGQHATQLNIWLSQMRSQGDYQMLEIVADRFLTSLVRRLVGTALDMARGRLPMDYLEQVLKGQIQPTEPQGRLAPPQGLYLCQVFYPPEFGIQPPYPDPLSPESCALIPQQALQDPGLWWD